MEWWDKKDRTYLPEGTPNAYGGYYTKEDIREIVAYAEKRCIEVIPEIELIFPFYFAGFITANMNISRRKKVDNFRQDIFHKSIGHGQ
mgnify:CR=1 FL=1